MNRLTSAALLGAATIFTILALVAFKLPGFIIGIAAIVSTAMFISSRRPTGQVERLRELVALSAEDLHEVIGMFDEFAYSEDPKHLADRTLHRPELLNEDSEISEIAEYHLLRANSTRFLRRLDAHLADPATTQSELENLLSITDQRNDELQTAWWRARTAAKELGT